MRKPPTGEPCAGEPHARFGGRGRRKPFPTPIDKTQMTEMRVDFQSTSSEPLGLKPRVVQFPGYEVAAFIYKLGIFFLRGTRPCGIESDSS